jgi:hypothetical protein
MEMEKWNNKQKELFELFFVDSKDGDCISISQLMNMIKPFNMKWKELYKNTEYSEFFEAEAQFANS